MTLTVAHGTFAYPSHTVLQDISFTANTGDLIAILGPNGAGKTTLLRCLLGFLRWKSGDSLLDGRSIRSIPQRELWRSIAYVPQARDVSLACSALETILLGRNSHMQLFAQPKATDVVFCESLMKRLGILHLRDTSCAEMSGGERQMVLIARALAAEPKILVLDEPESNLDFRNQLIVLDTMTSLARAGITCIFNTHYPDHALQRANFSLILKKNGSAVFGETHRVVTREEIRAAFGVETVIGEVETDDAVLQSILPLELADDAPHTETVQTSNRIATISVILQSDAEAEKVNAYLHAYNQYLIGRMGIPYRAGGVYIIQITLNAPESEIRTLTGKLAQLAGSSVKATFAKISHTT